MTSQNSVQSNRSIFAVFDDKRIEFLFSEYSDSCSLWIGKDGTMGDLALAIPAPDYGLENAKTSFRFNCTGYKQFKISPICNQICAGKFG
ncbi:Inhibitory regulator protein [Trichinella spiralis]|uniref:Inhibitory regulator protein n=1 Tax=Trichinella spiralis TaxID=6334 RepID=A0ABR3KD05_TRISP